MVTGAGNSEVQPLIDQQTIEAHHIRFREGQTDRARERERMFGIRSISAMPRFSKFPNIARNIRFREPKKHYFYPKALLAGGSVASAMAVSKEGQSDAISHKKAATVAAVLASIHRSVKYDFALRKKIIFLDIRSINPGIQQHTDRTITKWDCHWKRNGFPLIAGFGAETPNSERTGANRSPAAYSLAPN